MAHWAELDENNIVLRVLVGSNDESDEGYQTLINLFGGNWVKTSYNTRMGEHLLGGIQFRGNYAGIGYIYYEDIDAFMPPQPFPSWTRDTESYVWRAPTRRPEEGNWRWDEPTLQWVEVE